VAKGCAQRLGYDYVETHSPVVHMETICAILAITPMRKLFIQQLDVKGAYLNRKLKEHMYMRQPEGHDDGTGCICLLIKTLYSLKQAGREWNLEFNAKLRKKGYKQLRSDTCMYIWCIGDDFVTITVWVDNMLTFATTVDLQKKAKADVESKWEITNLGIPSKIVGIELMISPDSIFISSSKYIDSILLREDLGRTNSVSMPLDPNITLVPNPEGSCYDLPLKFSLPSSSSATSPPFAVPQSNPEPSPTIIFPSALPSLSLPQPNQPLDMSSHQSYLLPKYNLPKPEPLPYQEVHLPFPAVEPRLPTPPIPWSQHACQYSSMEYLADQKLEHMPEEDSPMSDKLSIVIPADWPNQLSIPVVTIHPNFHSPSQYYHHHLFSRQPSLLTHHHHQHYLRLGSLRCPYYGASTQRRQSQYKNYRTATCPVPAQNQHRNYKTATCLVLVHLQSPVNYQNTQSRHRPPDTSSQNHSRHTNVLVPLSVVTTLTSSNTQRDLLNLGGSIWHTHRHKSTSKAYRRVALHPLRNARASRMEATSLQTYHPRWSIHIAPRQVRRHRLHLKRRSYRAPQDPPINPPYLLPDMVAH